MPELTSPSALAPSVPVTVIGTGGSVPVTGATAVTPGGQPNLIVKVITPLAAITVRAANTYLTTLSGLVAAGVTTNAIPAADFYHLVMKCAGLAIAGAVIGLIKDLITVFGQLEGKYPLLTGSV